MTTRDLEHARNIMRAPFAFESHVALATPSYGR
jgi:hypothetical protein